MPNIEELRNRNVNIVFGNIMVIINRDKKQFLWGSGRKAEKNRFLFILYCILLLFDISNNVHKDLIKILFKNKIITVRPHSMI